MIMRMIQFSALGALLHASLASAQDVNAAKHLKRDLGTWNVVIKMFGDPNGEPAITKGTETNIMLGDMWLIGRFQGEVLGLNFEGLRQTSFDPQKKTFVASWVDSTSPYTTRMEGT